MSEVMDHGIIGMPFDMAMESEISRRQFYDRAQAILADRNTLSAECERLRAQVAERDAEIEEWSGTAVQNGMEVDRLTARLAELEAPAPLPIDSEGGHCD